MAQFHPQSLQNLRDKVVVLTGGALGIGSELVRLCHSSGAHVFFGDVLEEPGEALAKELSTAKTETKQHVQFVKTDVSSYASNLHLFDVAYETCGRVDHAVAAAGISERGNIINTSLTMESVREEPKSSMFVVDVNLNGVLYFARIASVYLRQPGLNDKSSTAAADKSLTLVSSVAGFKESPGLPIYSAAKHGVLGLMRAARIPLSIASPQSIRTNAICPWMTKTRLVSGIEEDWYAAGLPSNEPMDVAKIIAGVMADGSIIGGALYVEGGRAWEIEQGLDRTDPQWLGEKQSKDFAKGQKVLGTGDDWTKAK